MDVSQRAYLEQRYNLTEKRRPNVKGRRLITDFGFAGSELSGWTLYRARRLEHAAPPLLRTLWDRGDPTAEMLSIDVWECASIEAARDQLIEILGNIQYDDLAHRKDGAGIGEMEFKLKHSMILFQRANIDVFIRNAGPKVVSVDSAARTIDGILVRLSGRPDR
jgi:hypothetical protein